MHSQGSQAPMVPYNGVPTPYDLRKGAHLLFALPWTGRQVAALRVGYAKLNYMLGRRTSPYAFYDQLGVVFIHVPKNAGSSLRAALYGPIDYPHHSAQFLRMIDPTRYDAYKVFAAVRNPRARFRSAFQYLKYTATAVDDRRFATEVLGPYATFAEFLKAASGSEALRKQIMRWSHFRPQTEFVCDARGNLIVDALVAVEKLDRALPCLERWIARNLEMKHANASPPAGDVAKLDWSVIDAIYAADHKLWQTVHEQSDGFAMFEREVSTTRRARWRPLDGDLLSGSRQRAHGVRGDKSLESGEEQRL